MIKSQRHGELSLCSKLPFLSDICIIIFLFSSPALFSPAAAAPITARCALIAREPAPLAMHAFLPLTLMGLNHPYPRGNKPRRAWAIAWPVYLIGMGFCSSPLNACLSAQKGNLVSVLLILRGVCVILLMLSFTTASGAFSVLTSYNLEASRFVNSLEWWFSGLFAFIWFLGWFLLVFICLFGVFCLVGFGRCFLFLSILSFLEQQGCFVSLRC